MIEHPEHQHEYEPSLSEIPLTLGNLPRMPALAVISFYQRFISSGLPGNTCRFYPSCSHYGYQAIFKYGLIKGSLLATWRILRCQPFSKGGHDPVP